MNCKSYDWKAYALHELDLSARQQAESHAATCAHCREELATLRLTLDTLSTLREEEIPRRIAFVSDKVFEPRWWQRLYSPNFAAACVVAGAILVHAYARPGVASLANDAQIKAQINDAVIKAVSQVEAEHAAQTDRILAASPDLTQMYMSATRLERQ